MMNQLDAIEKRIRDLFESSSSILTGSGQSALLIHRLCESLQEYFSEEDTQQRSGIPVFEIIVNPLTLKRWQGLPDWEKNLVEIITSTAAEFDLHFAVPPQFTLTSRNSISRDEVLVSVSESMTETEETGAIPLQSENGTGESVDLSSTHACLILQGDKVIPLIRSVINIGRKGSNQIVINDLRISRTHAQIRRIQGNYVIFDVGSSGGTFVNSTRINQRTLRTGDVISLAGYPMIYTEDECVSGEKPRDKTAEIKVNLQKEDH